MVEWKINRGACTSTTQRVLAAHQFPKFSFLVATALTDRRTCICFYRHMVGMETYRHVPWQKADIVCFGVLGRTNMSVRARKRKKARGRTSSSAHRSNRQKGVQEGKGITN